MQYPAPLYSTVSQDINQQQQATVSNYLPNKTTNVAECNGKLFILNTLKR